MRRGCNSIFQKPLKGFRDSSCVQQQQNYHFCILLGSTFQAVLPCNYAESTKTPSLGTRCSDTPGVRIGTGVIQIRSRVLDFATHSTWYKHNLHRLALTPPCSHF